MIESPSGYSMNIESVTLLSIALKSPSFLMAESFFDLLPL